MIEIRTEHEECSDCTHTYELHITEGPITYEKHLQNEHWAKLYEPVLQQMLKPSFIHGLLKENPK